jgi:hypothetical protein
VYIHHVILKSVESKLTFYDTLATLVPGGVVLVAVIFACTAATVRFSSVLPTGVSGTALWLLTAYFLGYVVQAVGSWYERSLLIPRWGGLPSLKLLRNGDTFYSPDFKAKLFHAIQKQFALDLANLPDSGDKADKCRIEAFNLCYSYAYDRGIGKLAYIINATYALSRGIVVASAMSAIIFGGTASYLFSQDQSSHATLCFSASLFFVAVAWLADDRLERRGQMFADHLYRSFLAAALQTPPQN